MKKLLFFLILLIPINIYALSYPKLHYTSAIVYDLTDDQTLYEYNSEDEKAIASLTKILTTITAIENYKGNNKSIEYTEEMASEVPYYTSKAGLIVGNKYTFEDLLYGAILSSGADATVALAYATSNSTEKFVKLMNDLASEIGMNKSNFVNVHGLDTINHYSSAKDIQILLKYALENKKFKTIFTTQEYKLSTGELIKSATVRQSEKYNIDLSKVVGSKTGLTNNAGNCIAALMKHEKHDILLVTLGAPSNYTIPYNMSDTIELINFIEKNYSTHTLIEKNQTIRVIDVELSKQEEYTVKNKKKVTAFLPNDYKSRNFRVDFIGRREINYKYKKGEIIGYIKYYYKNEEIAHEDIFLEEKIKADPIKIIMAHRDNLIYIITIVFLILIIVILIFKKKASAVKA